MRKDLGKTNSHWGVCGFTSTFYAMWGLDAPGARAALINAPKAFNVLAEIKTYLRTLQAEAAMEKLKEITDFTRSFGHPFDRFTVDNYIARINEAVSQTEDQIKEEELFGIALPPKCVADYAQRIWSREYDIIMGDAGGDGIIGVKSSEYPKMTAYKGLCHWMYRYNNRIYSWGDSHDSVTAADPTYTVIWTLRLKG